MSTGPTVVDTDTHYWESVDIYEDYIDPKYRAEAPRLIEDDKGRLLVQVGQHVYPSAPGHAGLRRTYGSEEDMYGPLLEGKKVSRDPAARLQFMDKEHTDVHIVFPTLAMAGFSGIDDPGLAGACARAYNRFCKDFASADPARIRNVMLLPFNHPDVAIRELEYARNECGLTSAFANPTPPGDIAWHRDRYDALWSAMEDNGVVLMFHESALGAGPATVGVNRYQGTHGMQYLAAHTVEPQLAMMDVILGGVTVRHPKLNIGLFEAHLAWIPGWVEMLDHVGDRYPAARPDPELKASDLFKRQFFVSAFPDDIGLADFIERIGLENLVYSSDWPHKTLPDASTQSCMLDDFNDRTDLTAEQRTQILGPNAQRWLGL